MRFVTYQPRTAAIAVGAVDGGRVLDLQPAYARYLAEVEEDPQAAQIAAVRIPQDMVGLHRRPGRVAEGRGAGARRTPARRPTRVARRWPTCTLRAPLVPPVILNSGQNYWDHRDEKPEVDQKEPEFFLKTPLARDRARRARALRLDRHPEAGLRGRARRGDRQARPPHPGRARARPRLRLHGRERHHRPRPPGRARTRRAASSTPSGRARTSTPPRRSGRGSSRATRSPTRRRSACARSSTTRSGRTTRPRR